MTKVIGRTAPNAPKGGAVPTAITAKETAKEAIKPVQHQQVEKPFSPRLEELSARFALLGNETRLKLFWILTSIDEMCVCDLAERLHVTVSAISQHLAKFKAYGLMKTRRDASTIYYSLSEHPFNAVARQSIAKLTD